MTPPKVIYLQTCGTFASNTWATKKQFASDKTYFSEEAVLSIIQEAYEYQCTANGKKYEEGYSDGNRDACNAIKEAIKKLKGGEQ